MYSLLSLNNFWILVLDLFSDTLHLLLRKNTYYQWFGMTKDVYLVIREEWIVWYESNLFHRIQSLKFFCHKNEFVSLSNRMNMNEMITSQIWKMSREQWELAAKWHQETLTSSGNYIKVRTDVRSRLSSDWRKAQGYVCRVTVGDCEWM